MGKPLKAEFAAVLCVCATVIVSTAGNSLFASEPVVPTPTARTTFSGPVTGVQGNLISLAGGLTIDAASAKIVRMNDRDREMPIAAIKPGDFVQGVYGSSLVAPNHPLPAMIVRVREAAATMFGGYVQRVANNSITVAGQTAIIDKSTRFGSYQTLLDAQLSAGDVATVWAKAIGGRLVATNIDVRGSYAPDVPPDPVVGIVKSIGPKSWVIGLNDVERTIAVNPETTIEPDAGLGRFVTAVLNESGTTVVIGALLPAFGTVSAVSGRTVRVADGQLQIDISRAKIEGDQIAPGDQIHATYAASDAKSGPLPAMYVRIDKSAITIAGPLQDARDNTLVMAGREIAVTKETRMSDGVTDPTRVPIGTYAFITAQPAGATLVATDVCFSWCGQRPEVLTTLLHAEVATIGPSAWILRDANGHDWTILVGQATRITGDPKSGSVVDAILGPSDREAEVITASTAPLRPPQFPPRNAKFALYRGTVKSISESSVRIGSPESRLIVPDYVFPVQPSTPIGGSPREGDVVDVLHADGSGTIAVMRSQQATLPAMAVRGVVTWMQTEKGDTTCAEKPGWGCGWLIRTAMGIEQMIWTTSTTTVGNSPKVGDTVTAEVVPGPEGYVAQRITKDAAAR